ncbi:MAG: threonine synthase [Rhodospirillales bacterium]|nr:threonine synthase [Rhodospirillales bacterium]
MKYVSTRGKAPILPFDDVLLAGLARDGGLYVPETWPRWTRRQIRSLRGLSYAELAVEVMQPFIGTSIPQTDFARIVADAYAGFGHAAVAPLKQMGGDRWVLELFHGPTLSFKDYALQVVGRLFDYVLKAKGQRVTIVGATSGDTGSAAIEACRDRDAVDIFILHPKGRVSDVQRRQMTTVPSANVHNIAVEGTFDDCQDMVKAMFNDAAFRDRFNLSAVNSINWARIMVQIAYYFAAAVALGAPDRAVTFAVPTGNFGNVFAGYGARRMGLPIPKLIIGSNSNDILTRYFTAGTMETAPVVPTLSPSMDIQISSNFERLLFEFYRREGGRLAPVMERFRAKGTVSFGRGRWQRMRKIFDGTRLDDAGTRDEIRRVYQETGEMLDPHSIIGLVAGERLRAADGSALVAVATAHPAKFPVAVEEATGVRPELPARLADLFERRERYDVLPADIGAVKEFVTGRMARKVAHA